MVRPLRPRLAGEKEGKGRCPAHGGLWRAALLVGDRKPALLLRFPPANGATISKVGASQPGRLQPNSEFV